MPRDYKSRSRYQPESSGPSKVVWLFVGILIGLIISGILYLKNNHSTPVSINRYAPPPKVEKPKKPKQDQQKNDQNSQQNQQNAQNLQTQFDFYSVLPKNQNPPPVTQPQNTTSSTPQPLVPATQPAQQQTTTAAPAAPVATQTTATTTPTTTAPGNYVVQIATMSKPSDADKIKAQLSLLGFDVNVTPVQKNGQTMQRIWLGPFTTKSDAKATQQQLSQNQITSKLLKSTS